MDKKITVGVVLAIILGGVLYYYGDFHKPVLPSNEEEIEFITIEKQFHGGYDERANFVITSASEWEALWNQIASRELPKPPVPEVDFAHEMLIAVFMGTKNTGGYNIEVTRVTSTEKTVTVYVRETSPGPDCAVTLALTQPYHIVKVPRSSKEVIFQSQDIVIGCSNGIIQG